MFLNCVRLLTRRCIKSSSFVMPPRRTMASVDIKVEADGDLGFQERIAKSRRDVGPSIMEFSFNKKRVRILSDAKVTPSHGKAIVYWMFRDQRVQDNWAMLFAQRMAIKLQLPLIVVHCLLPKFLEATIRQYKFALGGLREVADDLKSKNIGFHIINGTAPEVLTKFVINNQIAAVICDFFPLRQPKIWINELLAKLPPDVPLIQVDAHNVVPCWEASDKCEYAARTIRPKITKLLTEYLTHFPPLITHPFANPIKPEKIDWDAVEESLIVDRTVKEAEWAVPGPKSGLRQLEDFVTSRLKNYSKDRNNPNLDAQSNLSPWFHFGQLSAQRAVLEVNRFKSKYPEAVAAFVEEAIVRRELSDNFCEHHDDYDNLSCASEWARASLKLHEKDKRTHLYTLEQFRDGKTHDDLWNASQLQLVKEGKLHGFLRMYWAKKILEWTVNAQQAMDIAIYLNDRYNLDGRDPNGYVGVAWSIVGVHDMGWKERSVFGKIRFMNYEGCKRKFDVKAFEQKYNHN